MWDKGSLENFGPVQNRASYNAVSEHKGLDPRRQPTNGQVCSADLFGVEMNLESVTVWCFVHMQYDNKRLSWSRSLLRHRSPYLAQENLPFYFVHLPSGNDLLCKRASVSCLPGEINLR